MDNDKQKQVPVSFLANPVHLLALGFGSGLSPKMPGTFGTLAGMLLYLVFAPSDNWLLYGLIVLVGFIAGIYICAYTASALDVHDHGGIVWDEIVGYWLTMCLVPKSLTWAVIGFCLFRLFDIWKPWPISLADRKLQGGLGIMLDDVLAALFSLLIIQITLYLL